MSILNELENILTLNKEIIKAKKKKMKSLPGWYGLDSPHAGSAGISENDMSELEKFYGERTERHINLVNKYVDLIKDNFEEFTDVEFDSHDASKYEEPEYTPYIHITWQYKCEKDGNEYNPPDGMEEKMKEVVKHHYMNNRHHPEFWIEGDIDEMEMPLNVTKMSDVAIAEMVADWCAMSEELGNNTPKEWADDNIGVKWDFDDDQKKLIYKLIDGIWSD